MSVAALSLGTVLLLVGGPFRDRAISPGPLTFAHGTIAQSCDECHVIGSKGLQTASVADLLVLDGVGQSLRCEKCHPMGPDALQAHAQDAARMAQEHEEKLRHGQSKKTALVELAAGIWPGVPRTPQGQLACATCHKEHHGQQADLRSMSDDACQACHARPFHSFSDGHPDLGDYPYHHRTNIAFDHVSHLGRHFKDFQRIMPNATPSTSCLNCHYPDTGGRTMLVRDFEHTCASCHRQQIEEPMVDGVVFLNLPGVDTETIAAQQYRPGHVGIGSWPRTGGGDPSPFLQLLLSADKGFLQARARLSDTARLRDLRHASDEQVRAAEQYVWAVKALVHGLVQNGTLELRQRLEEVLGQRLDNRALSALGGDLPTMLVRQAQQAWLPDLDFEIKHHRAGERALDRALMPAYAGVGPGLTSAGLGDTSLAPVLAVAAALDAARAQSAPTRHVSEGLTAKSDRWSLRGESYAIVYWPTGHADDFLRNWLDVSGRLYAVGPPHESRAIFDRLSGRYAVGRCTMCHSVEGAADNREVHWLARRPVPDQHPFTKFSHTVHFSLVQEGGCKTCHILNPRADVSRGFVLPNQGMNTNGKGFMSSFQGMAKAVCAECHTRTAAGDSCLLCHNYHVGTFPSVKPAASLEMFDADGRGVR